MALPLALTALGLAVAAMALAVLACITAYARHANARGFTELQRNALRIYVARQVAEQFRKRSGRRT